MTKNEVNINELIQEKYIVPKSVFDRGRTKTTHFLLNTVFSNSTLTTTEYFVNAFLDDAEYTHSIDTPIFVLFKIKDNDSTWAKIHIRLRLKPEYVLEYFCGTQDGRNLLMMIFQIPTKWKAEYINFKAGKYYKFSDEYKKLFSRYTTNEKAQPVESTIWRVIHKSDELRKELVAFFGDDVVFEEEDELWGIAEPKFEVYRYGHEEAKKR